MEANSKLQNPGPHAGAPVPSRLHLSSDSGREQGLTRLGSAHRVRPQDPTPPSSGPAPCPPPPSALLGPRPRGKANSLGLRPGAARLQGWCCSILRRRRLAVLGARPRKLQPQPGARSPRPEPTAALPGRPRPRHGEGDVQLGSGPEGGQEGRAQEQRGGAHHPPQRGRRGLQGPRVRGSEEWALGPRESCEGPVLFCARSGAGRGTESPRGPSSPFFRAAPLACPAQLLCKKVRGAESGACREIGSLGGLRGGGLENGAECTVVGAVRERARRQDWVRSIWRPAAARKTTKTTAEFGTSSQYNVPKMADIIRSLHLCSFLLSFLGRTVLALSPATVKAC